MLRNKRFVEPVMCSTCTQARKTTKIPRGDNSPRPLCGVDSYAIGAGECIYVSERHKFEHWLLNDRRTNFEHAN